MKDNPLFKALKPRVNKANWPNIDESTLTTLGFSLTDLWEHTHSATLHETMGSLWTYGVMFKGRPRAFNKQGGYYNGKTYKIS